MQDIAKKQLLSLFLTQLITAVIAVAVCGFFGLNEALGAGFGAGLLFVANLVFAIRFFVSKDYASGRVLIRFYTGAIFKWVVLIVGFLIAVKLRMPWWAFLVGFFATQLGFYLAAMRYKSHNRVSNNE